MIRILILFVAAVIFCGCTRVHEKIIGIKIYDYKGDFNKLAAQWHTMGINTAFVSTNLAADRKFRQSLKDRNIKVFIIFPVFFNTEILAGDSTLYAILNTGEKARQEWVEFVCPSRTGYRNKMIKQISELTAKLDPDGLSIDFIRQFVYWEKIYPDRDENSIDRACFCDSCISGFTRYHNISMPDTCTTTSGKADWIGMNHASAWESYRCDLITSMIKGLSEEARRIKNGILINVHIVPWKQEDFGGAIIRIAAQDLKEIAPIADFVSPMCYSQMLDRDADWISGVVTEMDRRAKGMVLPSIQVYPYYIERAFTTEDFRQCLEEALKPPSRGVVLFSWPLFEKDPCRMQVVREVIEQF